MTRTVQTLTPRFYALFLMVFLSIPLPPSAGQQISLKEVLEQAVSMDKDVQSGIWKQKRSEARMKEIARRGGWNLFFEATQGYNRGNRLDERDESLGRSPRHITGDLDEDEREFVIGLKNTILGPGSEREADIVLEHLEHLDREVSIQQARMSAAFTAAEAYLDVVEASRLRPMLEEQIAYAVRIKQMMESRSTRGEALKAEVLEIEYDLAQLRQKLLQLDLRTDRELRFLRQIMGRPELNSEELAPPKFSGAEQVLALDMQGLLQEAYHNRSDLRVATEALEVATDFLKNHSTVYPDVDIRIAAGYTNETRDFADRFRDDESFQVELGLEITIPLQIQARNRARKKRFEAEMISRELKLEDYYAKVERTVRRSYEDYQLADSECRVQLHRIAQAEEEERVLRLKGERLPELLGRDPEILLYRARARVLEAQADLYRAESSRLTCLLKLLSDLNRLLDANQGVEEISEEDLRP